MTMRRVGLVALLAGGAALIGVIANVDQARDFSCSFGGVGRLCEAAGLVAISGDWNEQRAWQLADAAVEREHRECAEAALHDTSGLNRVTDGSEPPCRIEHIGAYDLLYRDHESVVLLLALTSNSCHGCGAAISIFQFDRRRDGWHLAVSDRSAFEWGSWGGLNDTVASVRPIGEDAYGIFLTHSFMNQGYTEGNTAIWCKLTDHYRLVFASTTSGNSGDGIENWHSVLEVAPGSTGLFDIVATRVSSNRETDVVRFRFDGQYYVALAQ